MISQLIPVSRDLEIGISRTDTLKIIVDGNVISEVSGGSVLRHFVTLTQRLIPCALLRRAHTGSRLAINFQHLDALKEAVSGRYAWGLLAWWS